MNLFDALPLWLVVALFLFAAAVIAIAGVRMARVADELADATRMGEAVAGALLVGGATSLPGLMTTSVTAFENYPTLAVSNAIGGIAVQTLWLVIADLTHRRANLEHAAASPENILQGNLLIGLLCLPLLAMAAPEVTIGGFLHPVSLLMLIVWIWGMRMVRTVHASPMWRPRQTEDTVEDIAEESAVREYSLKSLWTQFLILTVVLGVAGYVLAEVASTLTERTPLSQSVMGGIFTSAASSLPELIVVIAAVRRGAHTLAVSNIIGGNALDTLFLLFADLGYRRGSIYHAVAPDQQFFMLLTVLMTTVLMMGLVRRQRRGFLGIGFESTGVMVLYGVAIATMVWFHRV